MTTHRCLAKDQQLSGLAASPACMSLLLLTSLLSGGCDNSITIARVPAAEAAKRALTAYDKNSDGQLSPEEIADAPGLLDGLPRADANGDGQLSADEITRRIEAWQDSPRKLINTPLVFSVRGRPIVGAKVVVKPASFLEEWLPASEGTTDSMGAYTPVISRELPGMPHGYYDVAASLIRGGKERLPEMANERSALGVELCADRDLVESNYEIRFELKPRRQ